MAALVKPSKYHRSLDGGELLRRREKKGLSQERLADIIQITQQFIAQLESPGPDEDWHHEVTTTLANKLELAFYK